MIKVNGISYGWGDVDVKVPGLDLVVQEISYDDEQEKEESYPGISITIGNKLGELLGLGNDVNLRRL